MNGNYWQRILKQQVNFGTANYYALLVESAPTNDPITVGDLTSIAYGIGGVSLAKQLVDVGGSNTNRLYYNSGSSPVRTDWRWDTPTWAALATSSGNPITGVVICEGTLPSSSTDSVVTYCARVNNLGVQSNFTPDGVTPLIFDFANTTRPVIKFSMAGYRFAKTGWDILKQIYSMNNGLFALVPVESAPTYTWETYSQLTNEASGSGNTYIGKYLVDIKNNYTNRIFVSGGKAIVRFSDLVWTSLSTVTNNPIVGFVMVRTDNSPPQAADRLVHYCPLASSFTPNGTNSLFIVLSSGLLRFEE